MKKTLLFLSLALIVACKKNQSSSKETIYLHAVSASVDSANFALQTTLGYGPEASNNLSYNFSDTATISGDILFEFENENTLVDSPVESVPFDVSVTSSNQVYQVTIRSGIVIPVYSKVVVMGIDNILITNNKFELIEGQ